MTVLVNPMLPKSVSVSKYLLTEPLSPFLEVVIVTEDVCIAIAFFLATKSVNRPSQDPVSNKSPTACISVPSDADHNDISGFHV